MATLSCVLLAALSGCGKSQPAVNQTAASSGGQVVTGTVTYHQTGPATAESSSGMPVGSAGLPPSTAGTTAPPVPAQASSPAPAAPQPTLPAGTSNAPAVGATANAPAGMPGNSAAGQSAAPAPSGKAGIAPSGSVAVLAAAVNQWRGQGANLVGATRLDDKPVLAGYSWMTHLLPYLGHQDLYKKFDFAKGWHEKENLLLSFEEIPAFLDPMNSNRHMKIVGEKVELGPAFTHYVGMAGVEDSRNLVAAELPRSDNRAGIFGYSGIARPEQITDGTSNTVMLVSAGKIVGPWVSGGGATVRGARAPYFDEITGFSCAGDPGAGALVSMADGSVKCISKDIDPAVFRALCTMHGAESVDLSAHSDSIRPQ